jgi:creatinine amidohydrolase
MRTVMLVLIVLGSVPPTVTGQTNPLWHEPKIKNYLPHMTWPEVQELLERTDMAIIPVGALEQHALHGPIGTDFYNALHRALLVPQQTDVLVAPVLWPGLSPYHMGFPGTITLSADTIQRVLFEATESLVHHGFRRIMFVNGHVGNTVVTQFVIERINLETKATAVYLREAATPFEKFPSGTSRARTMLDQHAGVPETSNSLYLTPSLVDMSVARQATVTMPDHLQQMVPSVVEGDPTATRLFRAEGLKPEETGKKTSAREISTTGAWSVRDPKEANVETGDGKLNRLSLRQCSSSNGGSSSFRVSVGREL